MDTVYRKRFEESYVELLYRDQTAQNVQYDLTYILSDTS